MINGKIDRYLAALFSLLILSIPLSAFAATGTVELTPVEITETSVKVSWPVTIQKETVFFDDFSDGILDPWSKLEIPNASNGVVEVIDDGGNYVLRKRDDGDPNTVNTDPNGGWAPLQRTIEKFELMLYSKRVVFDPGAAGNRYSITDGSGNGYGFYLHFGDGKLYMERRDGWVSAPLGTASPVSGGLTVGAWYTLQMTKVGQTLTVKAYQGRVDPATATPAATVSASDGTWGSFSQVNVTGGYDYDTDDVRVNTFENPAAYYDLRYSRSPINTDTDFENASRVDKCKPGESDLREPKLTEGTESCTVSQLFANTDYYFSLRVYGETGAIVLISICPTCPTHTLISGDIKAPANITDLFVEVADATKDTVKLCWTAPFEDADAVERVFFDDFSDGILDPWSKLEIPNASNGVVEVINDGGNYVLRKKDDGDPNTWNNDPSGGWAPLQKTIGDFDLVLRTKRVNASGGMANRYSITDINGNGYGFYLNFIDGNVYVERRNVWVSTLLGTRWAVSGGLTSGQWYTLRFTKVGNGLTARVYVGRVDPATSTPSATVSVSDGTWGSFSQVNVNGGYEYDTDDVNVYGSAGTGTANTNPATEYIMRYSTKYIVDDGITPGMGEVTFSSATPVTGVGLPKSPGSRECYTVRVQNILVGNDGILDTLDDIDRTPNTQFFFAMKSVDENCPSPDQDYQHCPDNISSLSNVASGLTAMSSTAYNMVSIPKVPNPNTPADVFGDDVSPSPLYLYRWDSRADTLDQVADSEQGCYDGIKAGLPDQYNPFNVVPACTGISVINEGKGYFLWSPRINLILDAPSGSIDVCTDPSLCVCTDEIGQSFTCYTFLLDAGWNMVGNPFGKEVDVSKINIQAPDEVTKAFQNAVASGWMEGAIYTHNGINYTDEGCNSISCDAVLQPWKGYWIWVKGGQGYKLLIPKP